MKKYIIPILGLLCLPQLGHARPSGAKAGFTASSRSYSSAKLGSTASKVSARDYNTRTTTQTQTTRTTTTYRAPSSAPAVRTYAPIPSRTYVPTPVPYATHNTTIIHHDGGSSTGSFLTGMATGALLDHAMTEPRPYSPVGAPLAVGPTSAQPPAPPVESPPAPTPVPEVRTPDPATDIHTKDDHPGDALPAILAILILVGGGYASYVVYKRYKANKALKEAQAARISAMTLFPQFPNLIPGTATISVPDNIDSNPPNTPNEKVLHFEVDSHGDWSIPCVGREGDRARLYLGDANGQSDFVWFDPEDPSTDCYYLSWYDLVAPDASQYGALYEAICQPTYTTADGVVWTRAWGTSKGTVRPFTTALICTDTSGVHTRISTQYTLYARDTGFPVGYPAREYLLIAINRRRDDRGGVDALNMTMHTGVAVSPADIELHYT